ncbi:MAG: MoaD/ThiS family protein [Myxococcales bacterium]|nr:MoaD/ThiS family protein [Myxococcales bacterium]
MQVNFFATLRSAVGQKTVEIPTESGDTVGSLLRRVLATYPDLEPLMLDDEGELSRYVHIFVNGRGVVHLPQRLDTPLAEDHTIDFFPAVAGG